MKSKREIHPPEWAETILKWYCKPELLEDLQGDLHEYFERHVKSKGAKRAKLIYIIDVLKFFRLYTVRKPEFISLLIHWIMIGSYVKTSVRSLSRNKLFSTINIFGLAISMSVGLLMISFLSDMTSYDSFHEKKAHIYRINTLFVPAKNSGLVKETALASSSVIAGKKIRETLPGIEGSTMLRNGFGYDAQIGSLTVPVSGMYADEHFFDVFSFPLLRGNPASALKELHSIVITEKTAKKLFGEEEALGKSVRLDTTDFVVTGVMKDIPKFSHIQFESLISFSTAELEEQKDKDFLKWDNVWQNYNYVVLSDQVKLKKFQERLDKMSAEENKNLKGSQLFLKLQPLKNIALGPELSNGIGNVMDSSVAWTIGGLSLLVILSACFNYTNLSIARSLRRTKEVGIRKVSGASKTHVLGQFITEAVVISLLALVLSFLLFLLLRPYFLTITPKLHEMIAMDLSVKVVGWFVLFATATGIGAGLLPALFFSRINAMQVLRDVSTIKVFRSLTLRKALVVVQYTLSLMFVTGTVIGYNQYKNFITFDLGFTTENIYNLRLKGNNPDLLEKEIREMPEVKDVSKSQIITSVGNYYGTRVKYNDPTDSASLWFNTIDENYLRLHDHKLLAGRNFNPKTEKAVESEVIVNEATLQRFNIGQNNPAKAIGEFLTVNGKKVTIVGVMRDFHYGKLDTKIEPVIFRQMIKSNAGFLNLKISSTDWPSTLARLEGIWKKIDKVHPMEGRFYSEEIEQSYREFSDMLKVVGFLALLAVCIASVGLLGMVVFSTETRVKEISIRKVLGASEGTLIYLLSRGFLLLLTLAALIAIPATYFIFHQFILADIVYKAPVTASEAFGGLFAVGAIALLMICLQALKVARRNPSEVLRNE